MMSGNIFTPEQIAFLTTGYATMRLPELTAAFNSAFCQQRPVSSIRGALRNRKITCGRKPGLSKGHSRIFTPEQVDFIREQYGRYSRRELTAAVNARFNIQVTTAQITGFVKTHKINSGRTGYFQKGQQSWNAGTTGLMKPNIGNFAPGHVPANLQPVGHERICSKDGVMLIKTDETNPYTGAKGWYRHKHIVIWEQHNGPVPDGHVIRFRDNDKLNSKIENLLLVSKAEHLHLNRLGFSACPEPLKDTALVLAKMEVGTFDAIRRIKKKENSRNWRSRAQ